jgi:hypothetical protein
MNRILLLLFITLSFTTDTYAQLTAEAGSDTVVCNPLSYPRLGGAPTALAGTPPYSYNWELVEDPPNTFFYLDIVTSSNPKVRGVTFSGDTMVFRVTVTDGIGSVAIDLVKVMVARWTCTGGKCVKNIMEGDTVSLGTGCNGNFPPHTIAWTPSANLSSTTSSNPKTWTKTSTNYYAKTTNAIGCYRDDTCVVNVTKLGVKELAKKQGYVGIHPNPVNESSVLHISNDMLGGELKVFTIDGRLILQQPVTNTKTMLGSFLIQSSASVYIYSYEKQGMKPVNGKWVSE